MLVFFITFCDSWIAKSPDITLFKSPINPYPIPPPNDQMYTIPCFYKDIEFYFLKNNDKFVDTIRGVVKKMWGNWIYLKIWDLVEQIFLRALGLR